MHFPTDTSSSDVAEPEPAPVAIFHVPYNDNRFFTGRERILNDLQTTLSVNRATALTQAITGLGGVGKTQTAVKYAYLHQDEYRVVLWARADTEANLITDYREIAALLNLPESDAGAPRKSGTPSALAEPARRLPADHRQRRRARVRPPLPPRFPEGARSHHVTGTQPRRAQYQRSDRACRHARR